MSPARVLLLFAALGCGSCTDAPRPSAPAPAPRGVAPVRAEPQAPAPPATPAPSHPPVEWREERAPAAAPPSQAEAEAEKKPERNYEAELRAGLGNPASCVKPRVVGPETPRARELQIDVEAYVVGAGSISRSYVRAPQLTPEESDCVRSRVDAIRFKAPVDDAPRSVRASFKLTLQPPAKKGP